MRESLVLGSKHYQNAKMYLEKKYIKQWTKFMDHIRKRINELHVPLASLDYDFF